jgi:hypothetical protein
MGRTVEGRHLVMIVATALAVIVVGCGSGSTRTSTSAATALTPSPQPTWRDLATQLGSVVFQATTSVGSWSSEPAGDLWFGAIGNTVVFARLVSLSPSGRTLTFDAAQLYIGDSAVAAARREGKPAPPSGFYIRNAYRHVQSLAVATGCPVVLQFPQTGDTVVGRITVITAAELERRLPHGVGPPWFWLIISPKGVITAIVQQYLPA